MKKTTAIEVSPLVSIVNESGLEKTKAQFLLDNFSAYFKLASEWEQKAKTIKVTSADQKFEMKVAREGRLMLREKRVGIEHARVELGSQALREKQTIDSIARILKNLIEPIEKYLDDQEHFIEIEAEKALNVRSAKRVEALSQYDFGDSINVDPSLDIRTATDEQFQEYLGKLEAKKQAKVAELKRIAQEQADREQKRQDELKKAQDEAKKQQKLRELLAKRAEKLTEIGFRYNGFEFQYDEILITVKDMMTLFDPEFKQMVSEHTKTIKDREAVKEKTRKQAEESDRKAREAEEARVKKIQDDARATQKRLDDIQKAQSEIKVSISEAGEYSVEFNGIVGKGNHLPGAVLEFCEKYIDAGEGGL